MISPKNNWNSINQTSPKRSKTEITLAAPRKYTIKYENVFLMIYLHSAALYGIYLSLTCAKMTTVIFVFPLSCVSNKYVLAATGLCALNLFKKNIFIDDNPLWDNPLRCVVIFATGLCALNLFKKNIFIDDNPLCDNPLRCVVIFAYCLYIIGGLGITAGAHRLWAHKTYKATLPLEFFIMILNCIALQYTVINWVRDHRLHHKYSDTDADPHNARRGFFYSHIGWLLVKKSELVKERGKTIDISDVVNNPVLKFQKKYAVVLFGMASIVLPTLIPVWCWGETLSNSWHLNVLRYIINLNASLLVNSAAHIYGNKPYDRNIMPSQNVFVSYVTVGEGFHNFHHAFPCDYRTAELGQVFYYNVTTWFIDLCAWLGLAYDLKSASQEFIEKRAQNSGDGTRFLNVRK